MPDDKELPIDGLDITEEELAALKAKFGEINLLEACDEQVLVRTPPYAEWQRFFSMANDPDQRSNALDTLTRACIVYPDKAGVNKLLNLKPALGVTFGNEISELAGLAKKVSRKKL